METRVELGMLKNLELQLLYLHHMPTYHNSLLPNATLLLLVTAIFTAAYCCHCLGSKANSYCRQAATPGSAEVGLISSKRG
jgi:hypothetical protein